VARQSCTALPEDKDKDDGDREDTPNRVHELEQAWHAQVEAELAETLEA
jgi:hypothetical protein